MSKELESSEKRIQTLIKEIEKVCAKSANTMRLHEVVISLTTYSNSILKFGLKTAIEKEVEHLEKQAKK